MMQITWEANNASVQVESRLAAHALQQSSAYGGAMQLLGLPCLCATIRDDNGAIAQARFVLRKFAGFATIALCAHGPVWLVNLSPARKAKIYALIKKSMPIRWPRFVFFSPDDQDESAQATARMSRVLTGYSTVRIDLSQDIDALRAQLAAKWRNRLVAAESSALNVIKSGSKPAQYRWLLEREGLQRQARAYHALPADFVTAFQQASQSAGSGSALVIMRADLGKSACAAMMFLVHGAAATYHIGWSDDDGRRYSAHNLLLWRAILMLKAQGIQWLDLGGVNTQRGAGIARFKIGSGGQVMTFPGTFY